MRNGDRQINRAIEAGEQNRRAKELIENWCSHARVVKFGGTGLIEAQTGLPIGHHFIECDYAEARGPATWLIADAAVDFHDRNCASCQHRAPVGLPNLVELIKVRDEQKQQRAAERQRLAKEMADALAARHEKRQTLKGQLDAVGATIVDQLDVLDRESGEEAREALVNTARLAPDVFVPPLVEHLFSLLEARECWFNDTGLKLLQELRVDPARLTRCALLCLGQHSSVDLAASIVESNAQHVDERLLEEAFPALVLLASPLRTPSMTERRSVPEPLLAVHRAYPTLVEAAINKLFRDSKASNWSIACRAIITLSKQDHMLAARVAEWVAVKLVHADRLEDEDAFSDEIDDTVYDLCEALAKAIEQAPDDTDALILKRIEVADGEGQAHLYSAYREVLRIPWRKETPVVVTRAHIVSLKRLLWAVTGANELHEKVIREIQSAFYGTPDELAELARLEMEGLLGAALLLDDRLNALDAPSTIADVNPLTALEKLNRRQSLSHLQGALIRWAANGAVGDPAASRQYMTLLSDIPVERDALRATMLEEASVMTSTADGLTIVLPALYSAMVGTSNRMRASAAALLKGIERRRKDDLPDLVFEALVMQLRDPYVIVHRSAVWALETITLPENLNQAAKQALWILIRIYADDQKNDDFLYTLIGLFASRYATDEQRKGAVGQYLISLLRKMHPYVVSRHIGFLSRMLELNSAYPSLLLDLVTHAEANEYDEDRVFDVMAKLPVPVVLANRVAFESAAISVSDRRHLAFIEVLTRACAWAEAVRVAEAAYAKIPDTNWNRPRRLMANLDRIAVHFENAIATSDMQALTRLAGEWRDTCAAIEKDEAKNAKRRNPLAGLLGSD